MAENKKAFVLYADILSTFDYLTMEQRGQVITWVLQYVNDMKPEPLPGLLAAICEPIKQQLKRDLIKYETRAANSRKNGKKGGAPTKTKNPKKPSGIIKNPGEPKKPDTVTVTVTDKVTVTDNVILLKETIENYLISSFTWKEAVLRKLKTNGINTTILVIDKFIRNFAIELEATEDLFKTGHENKKHFTHWVTIQLKNEKTTTNKKQSRNESNAEHNAKTAQELGFGQNQ